MTQNEQAAGHVRSLLNGSLKLGHFSIYRGPSYGPHRGEPTSEEWETRLAPISVARVSEIMTEFVLACNSAARDLKQLEIFDFYAPGGAWRQMVESVATFYNARGYKATARNDRGVQNPSLRLHASNQHNPIPVAREV